MFFPEVVRFFFSNFHFPVLPSHSFSSYVFGYLFTIPLDNLAGFLHIPRIGEALADESELPLFNFDYAEEFHALMGVLIAPHTFMLVSSILSILRLLHCCISRIFVPRTDSLDMVLPLDLWIISHDVHDVPLDYSHLVFETLFRFSDASLAAPLSFGPLITSLLLHISVDLSPFRSITPSIFPMTDDVMDLLEIVVEGEDDEVLWISNGSNSRSASNDDDPQHEPFVEALQALLEYGYEDNSEGELP
ncbi:unnamed protein product [Linum trigynum]|uniref:Uncharacterized protein n=1 Tax=Linum trigynum TaxID=586398 RepID=A0AAV2DXT9_9ROSI